MLRGMNGDKARPSDTDGARPALAWLAHPITIVGLIVLLVNDHLLKTAWPGLVTGKLSDVAGLILAPPLLATLILLAARRAPAQVVALSSLTVVGLTFAVVKALPAAAGLASQAWSVLNGPSIVRADATDLLALPALGLAWHAWTRARHRPAPGNLTRAVRLGVILPVALAGVVATSPPEDLGPADLAMASGVGPGVGNDDVILVRNYWVTAVSWDGLRWRDPPDDDRPQSQTSTELDCDALPFDTMHCSNYNRLAILQARQPHRMQCTGDGRQCYRVVPDALRIEQSTDGGATWTTGWDVGDLKRERYLTLLEGQLESGKRRLPDELSDIRHGLTCTTVYLVPASGAVVAACGLIGFVSRSADGVWAMIGFDGDPRSAPVLVTTGDFNNKLMILMFGWFIFLLAAEAHAMAHPRGLTAARRFIAVLASSALLVIVLTARLPGTEDSAPVIDGVLSVAVMLVGGLIWFVLYLVNRGSFPWWVVPLAVAATVVDWTLANRVINAQIGWAEGWIGIWAVTVLALAANVALGLVFPRSHRVAANPAAP